MDNVNVEKRLHTFFQNQVFLLQIQNAFLRLVEEQYYYLLFPWF